jgi:hypothetical protein
MESSIQIAWNYLDRTGEAADRYAGLDGHGRENDPPGRKSTVDVLEQGDRRLQALQKTLRNNDAWL